MNNPTNNAADHNKDRHNQELFNKNTLFMQTTERMYEIEAINNEYNAVTNNGASPNGEENRIEALLFEWDVLKRLRDTL
jgi:hypothetical protein